MTSHDPDPLAEPVQKAHEWIGAVRDELGVPDRRRGYQALRSVLHALRDRLPLDATWHLGSQLPLVVRGIYYEGWDPSPREPRPRGLGAFLDDVRAEVPGMLPSEAEIAARAVFAVVGRYVSPGEVEDVQATLTSAVRDLWTVSAHT